MSEMSHGHYDHSGGLMKFALVNPSADIYMRENADGEYYSFKEGKATVQTFESGTKLYRVGGKKGNYWSPDPPPETEYQWRVKYAIKQDFGNDASSLYTITIPEGASISGWTGIVGSQGMGLYGGWKTSIY